MTDGVVGDEVLREEVAAPKLADAPPVDPLDLIAGTDEARKAVKELREKLTVADAACSELANLIGGLMYRIECLERAREVQSSLLEAFLHHTHGVDGQALITARQTAELLHVARSQGSQAQAMMGENKAMLRGVYGR